MATMLPTSSEGGQSIYIAQVIAPAGNHKNDASRTSWWFQPSWKILVKIGNLPQVGVKIKNVGNHHLDNNYLVIWKILGFFSPN